jgi:hypothetical protein
MLPAVYQLKRPRTFLLDMFFRGFKQFTTKYVDIDIYSRSRKMAPFVSPNVEGRVMARLGKTTNSYAPPYIKPKRPTTAGDLLVAQPGEAVYSPGTTMEQRAAQLLMQDFMDLDDSITRREEWMAASALQAGTIRVLGDGVDDTIDFGMKATHKITLLGADLWTAPTSDPVGDLTTWSRLAAQDSGIVPDTVVLGQDVAAAFIVRLRDPNYNATGELSSIKLSLGQIVPKQLPNGVTFLGTLVAPSLNVDVYQYDEWYYDETAAAEKPMVPVNMVLVGSAQAQNNKLYGAIQNMKAVESMGTNMFAVPRFPSSWIENDPAIRQIMLESASLVALNQPDAFVAATAI